MENSETSASPSEVSDADLLAAHVAGDPYAFEAIVRRHQARLWAVALRTMRNREEAADALQDAFVSAYRNAARFRGDAQVGTWLYRVVVNACLDRLRRAKARPTVPLPDYDLSTRVDHHAQTEARLVLAEALEKLPEHQRAAIVLVDLHELSVLEAADALGVAEGTVKSRCSRGRAMLAEILRERNQSPAPHVTPLDGAQNSTTQGRIRHAGSTQLKSPRPAPGDHP